MGHRGHQGRTLLCDAGRVTSSLFVPHQDWAQREPGSDLRAGSSTKTP